MISSSELAQPLNALCKSTAVWQWGQGQKQSFSELKEAMMSAPCLMHYDPNKPIILTTDASPHAVSAILSHRIEGNEYMVACGSRTLSGAETKYSQLDCEAVGIMFGVRKFQNYLLRQHLVTDKKPLQLILSWSGFRRVSPAYNCTTM